MRKLLWTIGSPDGHSDHLVDNYKEPNLLGDVCWRVPNGNAGEGPQRWPLFHPSEADPEAGYREHVYTILFDMEKPEGTYKLSVQYLVIAPRLAHLELRVNGVKGNAYLRPEPSKSGEILLLSGLHTTIYSEGTTEVLIPAALLRSGENRLELVARDGGEVIHVDRIEAVKRLDRMANGAGFLYQWIGFEQVGGKFDEMQHYATVVPDVTYSRDEAGNLVEDCHLYLELGGPVPDGNLVLSLDEESPLRSEEMVVQFPATQFGHVHIPFRLFDGADEGEVWWRVNGRVAGKLWSDRGIIRRRRKWKVFLTPHAHTDIGYTHRQWEVAERLCRNIDYALDMLEREPASFTYHLDASWALEHYLATRDERRKAQLVRQVKAGRLGVAANYVDLLTQTSGLEDLIRNFTVTDTLLRPLGLSTDFAAVVDVASMSSAYPDLLDGAGVKYLVHANNQDRGPFRLNGGLHRASPFYWEGQAGGRVLVWLAKMYCELRKVCGSPPVADSAARGLEMWLQEYEGGHYAPDAVLLYGQEADNTDLDPQPVSFVKQWNERYVYPQLIPCDVSEFFRYVEERWARTFPVFKGDGGAYWEDGAGSSIAQTTMVRRAQAALPAAERLEALAVLHTPGWAFPLGHFDEAWRQTLLYDEHTWGAFMSAREPEALLTHDQWAVKEGFASQSEAWATRLLHTAAVRHSLTWNNDGREVVVYNPHSWPVSGPITVEIEPGEIAVDPETGAEIPMRRLRVLSTQATVQLWIANLPGLSYRRFVLKRVVDAAQRDDQVEVLSGGLVTLENDHYRLVFDLDQGAVASWFDKSLGRSLADGPFGQLLYARGGEGTRLISNQADLPDGNPEVLAEFRLASAERRRFAWGTALRVTGDVPCGTLTLTVELPASAKWVDLQYTYDKEERLAKEAVYVAFPLDLPGATVRSDSHLGWVNWDKEQLPGGCKEWLPLQTGILASGEGAEVLICSPDIPLFTVGSVVQGRWPKEMDLTGGHIFSYVLNNYWHTNYKGAQGGPVRFGYRLTSGAQIGKPDAYRMGWEARRGLYGHRMSFQDFRETRAPYAAPAGGTLAVVGSPNVVLSTLTAARWGEGFVARLQEISGAAQMAPVRIPGRPVKRACLVDLLERDRAELTVQPDGSVTVPVPAWGLASVRIEF